MGFFSSKSESVTVTRTRTRTIKIEITDTWTETTTRRIESSLYATPQIDIKPLRYLELPEYSLPKYIPTYSLEDKYDNYFLPEKKEKKKDPFDEFFEWLFS